MIMIWIMTLNDDDYDDDNNYDHDVMTIMIML